MQHGDINSGRKLEDTIPSVLKNNVGPNRYTCQSNFYYVKNYYKNKKLWCHVDLWRNST